MAVLLRGNWVEQFGVNAERANRNLALGNPEEAYSNVSTIRRDGITLLCEQTYQPAGPRSCHPAAEKFLVPGRKLFARQRKNGSMVVVASEELVAEKRLGQSRLQGNPSNRSCRLHDVGTAGCKFPFQTFHLHASQRLPVPQDVQSESLDRFNGPRDQVPRIRKPPRSPFGPFFLPLGVPRKGHRHHRGINSPSAQILGKEVFQ